MADGEGELIGGFRVIAMLRAGSGAQGSVYRAVCENDDYPRCPRGTTVALKTMTVLGDDAEAVYRKLERQTKILCEIEHPNVVRYYGCFSGQTQFSEYTAVVEELLEGETLQAALERNPSGLDVDEALRVTKAMVAGLDAVESRGIVHRDVKPANVFLCSDGSVKIIDFEVSEGAEGTVSTASGNMVGTFEYMAPDFTDPHFSGDQIADVFSAGVVMHEMFAGKLPYPRFSGDARQASFAFLDRWARDAQGDFRRDALQVSSRVERFVAHAKKVLQRALAPKRSERFSTFSEFKAALEGVKFRDLKNGEVSYRMLQLVGKGGFGEVFKARSNGRTVAIKHLLKPEYAARFYREAKIMSELNDSCFVRFFDFFVLEHGSRKEAFLVMDFLPGMPGSSLRDAIRRSAGCGLPFECVIQAFIRYAHGLKLIHDKGVFHRDIKPTNLYYPESRPDEASIMDLGIARETDGTETTGLVPGTLDYMPPETVTQGTRGDAAMDIYALGLCLYEALTGKKGYPRLPGGSAGYAQFFKRAREKTRPALDDARIVDRPNLKRLIERMTEPEVRNRLSDAGKLEEELRRIRDGADSEGDAILAEGAATAGAEPLSEDDEAETDDAATCETAFIAPTNISRIAQEKIREQMRKLDRERTRGSGRHLAVAVVGGFSLLAAAISAAWIFRSALYGYVRRFGSAADALVRREVGPSSTGTFNPSDSGVPDLYGDDTLSLEKADLLRDRWLGERKPPTHSAAEYERLVGILASYREQRVIRDRLKAERSRIERELQDVVQAYRTTGIAEGDRRRENWRKAWRNAPTAKLAEAERVFGEARRERQRTDERRALADEASSAAAKVCASYLANGEKIADREYAVWRNNWKDRLLAEDFARLSKGIELARSRLKDKIAAERRLREAKTLEAECRSLCDMLEPVASRMNRLNEAEMRIREGRRKGLLDETKTQELLAAVAHRRKWTVFEIRNNSDLELTIDSCRLANGSSRLFVYTNRPPEDLSATCPGYEPLALGRQTNGKVLRLLPEYFNLLKVSVSTGTFGTNVFCQVDGVSVRPGILKLLPGVHECVYIRKTYRRQSMPFKVEVGTASTLPPPGEWIHTDEWFQQERERIRLEKVARTEARIQTLLADDPVLTRPRRLRECAQLLSDLAKERIVNETVLAKYRSELSVAERWGLGVVENETDVPFAVEGARAPCTVEPKSSLNVAFLLLGTARPSFRARGYEPVSAPSGFDGSRFVLQTKDLTPLQVAVMIPDLEEGVTWRIDGEGTARNVFLFPGKHVCVYSRADYDDCRVEFEVRVAEPQTVPRPLEWKARPELAKLVAAEAAADAGDWMRAASLLAEAREAGVSNRARLGTLGERILRQERFREQRDRLAAFLREERWAEALKCGAALVKGGSDLSADELQSLREAGDKALEGARFDLTLAERPGSQLDAAKVARTLHELEECVSLLTAHEQKGNN